MTTKEIKHDLEVICPKITKTTGCNDETICADCIADCLKAMGYCKRETLLKEFVEWLKGRFDKRIDQQTAKYERIVNEGDDGGYLTSYLEYVANNEGILTGFVNAKWWLEELDTIEKFMEEHNGK